MAVAAYIGSLTPGNPTVTGLTLSGTSVLILWGNRKTADANTGSVTADTTMPRFFGAAVDASHQIVVDVNDDYSTNWSSVLTTNKCVRLRNAAGTVQTDAAFSTWNSDGFTLTFTTGAGGTQSIVNYLVITGLTGAQVANYTSATSATTQPLTGAGFAPNCALLVAQGDNGDDGIALGFLGSTTSRAANGTSFNGTLTTIQRADRAFVQPTGTTGTALRRAADLASFDSDGLTLSWSTVVAGGGCGFFVLYLQGIYGRAGAIVQPTSPVDQSTSVGSGMGTPVAALFGCVGQVSSTNPVTGNAPMAEVYGGATASGDQVVYYGSGSAGVAGLDRTQAWFSLSDAASPTTQAKALLKTMDPGGFTLTYGAADATQREIIYFVLGGPPPTRTQEGYRFRNDDGSEATATWKAAQDTDISAADGTAMRLRVVVDTTGDSPQGRPMLQYRKVGDADWKTVM